MILSEQTFIELAGKQEVLDAKIKQAKCISYLPIERIEVAYRIEVAECVNEMKGDVKYWSGKPMNREAFIEEFVDAFHFFLSYVNHLSKTAHGDPIAVYFVELLNEDEFYKRDEQRIEWEKWELAEYALKRPIVSSFGALLYLVEQYGFTEQDIIDTYNRKNAVNHDRSDSGVYLMQLDTQTALNALIEQNRRIQGYAPNCDCGNEATLQQPDIFGGTTGYCQSCYDALGGEGE